MKLIALSQGQFAQVDDEDYDDLIQYKWYAHKDKKAYYAVRKVYTNGGQKSIRMHRQIMNTPDGMVCDHADHDTLNYQRNNLRNCSSAQNNMNKTAISKTGFMGVYIIASIRIDGKTTHLGTFATVEEAAKAYDEAAKLNFGDFANLNFE